MAAREVDAARTAIVKVVWGHDEREVITIISVECFGTHVALINIVRRNRLQQAWVSVVAKLVLSVSRLQQGSHLIKNAERTVLNKGSCQPGTSGTDIPHPVEVPLPTTPCHATWVAT